MVERIKVLDAELFQEAVLQVWFADNWLKIACGNAPYVRFTSNVLDCR